MLKFIKERMERDVNFTKINFSKFSKPKKLRLNLTRRIKSCKFVQTKASWEEVRLLKIIASRLPGGIHLSLIKSLLLRYACWFSLAYIVAGFFTLVTQPHTRKRKYLTHLMASIICSPILTQFAACCGREIGKPDTQ